MSLPLSIFTIVFNGQPFIEGNIRESLRQADVVSVVEGATNREAKELGNGIQITGKPDSDDGTVEILKRLQSEFPRQLKVVFANGKFWRNKTQMVEVALKSCVHGVLVQKDVDEFHFDSQMAMVRMILSTFDYSDMDFHTLHFWADRDWHVALTNGLWGGGDPWRRAWLWYGENVISHEPPRFRRRWENVLSKEDTRALGLVFHHHSYSCFENVLKKQRFYGLHDTQLIGPMLDWLRQGKPEVGPPGKMVKFKGEHPPDVPNFDPWPI